MALRAALQQVKDCIGRGQRFALTTHVNPDGDGLGSEAALAGYLKQLKKDVYIYNSNDVPANYEFLNHDGKMTVYRSEEHRETLLTVDYLIILDISDWQRLRQLGADVREMSIKKICIDHHPSNEKFGEMSIVDVKASSTGEIVYDLITFCGGQFTRMMAEAIYTSILTDTGSFRFSNTNAKAFAIAAEMVRCGVKTNEIYQRVYERQSRNKVRLFAHVLNNLNFVAEGKIAWFIISLDAMESFGAKPNDTEGFADYPRVIEGVEVSVMFIEMAGGKTKVSLRSKGEYIINTVAQKLGGGGHQFAAGILLDGPPPEHIGNVIKALSAIVRT